MIKLLIVDDQPQTRRGLRMRLGLEPDLEIVGEAGDGRSALTLVDRLHPDVIVMDCEMPLMDGISAASALRDAGDPVAVVMLSIHDDAMTKARARAAGASAFVAKQCSDEPLIRAIRQAADQHTA